MQGSAVLCPDTAITDVDKWTEQFGAEDTGDEVSFVGFTVDEV